MRSCKLGRIVWLAATCCTAAARAEEPSGGAGAEFRARARVAEQAAAPPEDATASATTVDAQNDDSALRDVPQAIAQVPGVRLQQTGGFGSVAYAALRGAEIGHTTVLLDTISLNTADSGPFDLSLLPLEALDRIEVYRGGAPVWIGDGAIGGIVRLVPAQAERTYARESIGAGSFGRFDLAGTSAVAGADEPHAALLSHVRLARADNDYAYVDDGQTRFDPSDDRTLHQRNAGIDTGDGLVHAGVDALGGRVSFLLAGDGRTEGVPGPLARPTAEAHRQLVRVLGAAGYERETLGANGERASRVQFSAGVSQQTLRFDDRLGELGMGRPTSTDDVWQRGFARAGFGLRVLPWLEPTLVTTLAHDSYRPHDAFAFSAPPRPSQRTTAAVALEPRLIFHLLSMPAELRPSARLEWSAADVNGERDDLRRTGSDAVSVHDNLLAPTYRIAFGLQPTPALQLSTSAATGKRIPSIYELFGDRAFAEPNPRLQPERSRSVDASAIVHGRAGALRGSVELRGFALFIDDMIRYERTSQFTARPDNIASARILGLELGANAALGRNLSLISSLTLMQTRNELGKSLAFRPPVELLVRPELSLYPPGVDRVALFGEMHHVAFVYLDDDSNDTSLPGRTLFDLGCAVELLRNRVIVQARVRNLFDVQASDVLSRALPGREFLTLLSLQQEGY